MELAAIILGGPLVALVLLSLIAPLRRSGRPAAFVSILLIGLLLSEGSGGIPGGGFVIALIYVQAFNLPIEIAAIVGGIYRLVDMGNTTVNIMGDFIGTVLVGIAFAAGWTPCIGPVLGAILTLAGTQDTIWSGVGLLAAYSAALGRAR